MTAPDLARDTEFGRYYAHPVSGAEVPSITNILDEENKPGISGWGYRTCGEFVADNLDAITKLKERQAIIDLVKGSPYRSSSDSSGVGDVVHNWIDRHIRGETIPSEEFDKPFTLDKSDKKKFLTPGAGRTARGMWASFKRLESRYKIEWILSEVTVWSDEHDYAGTYDALAKVGGYTTLIDWKTGTSIYPSVALQVSAAHYADYAFDDTGNRFNPPKAVRWAAGHLRPTFGELNPLTNMEENFKAFLGYRAVFEWRVNYSKKVVKYSPKIKAEAKR